MAKGNALTASQPPETPTPALKKSTSNTQNMKNQKTLFGFFQKTPSTASTTSSLPDRASTVPRRKGGLRNKSLSRTNSSQLTPAPSSDALDEDDTIPEQDVSKESSRSHKGLPSPVPSANGELVGQTVAEAEELTASATPSRKVSEPRFFQLSDKLI